MTNLQLPKMIMASVIKGKLISRMRVVSFGNKTITRINLNKFDIDAVSKSFSQIPHGHDR